MGVSCPLVEPSSGVVFAVLLLHRNQVVSTERLIDEIWDDEPPATAAKVVQVYISQLRKAQTGRHGPKRANILVTRAPGYVLRVGPGEMDADRFEQAVDEGRRALMEGRPRRAAHRLLEGLALWRGPALADFALQSFAQSEIARLEESRVAALEDRIEADLALGRHADPHRRDRVARLGTSDAREASGPVDAGSLSLGETGRGSRCLSRRSRPACRRTWP